MIPPKVDAVEVIRHIKYGGSSNGTHCTALRLSAILSCGLARHQNKSHHESQNRKPGWSLADRSQNRSVAQIAVPGGPIAESQARLEPGGPIAESQARLEPGGPIAESQASQGRWSFDEWSQTTCLRVRIEPGIVPRRVLELVPQSGPTKS